MKAKKLNKQAFRTSAAREKNALLVSSKILADLKYKGILAFKQMTDDDQKRVWQWSKLVKVRNINFSNSRYSLYQLMHL